MMVCRKGARLWIWLTATLTVSLLQAQAARAESVPEDERQLGALAEGAAAVQEGRVGTLPPELVTPANNEGGSSTTWQIGVLTRAMLLLLALGFLPVTLRRRR